MQSPFIVELNEQNFREVLEGSMQTPVLIHFWAPMSQESSDIIPQLNTLAQQYNGAFTLALLNCEQQQQIAAQFGVQALPTIALFNNGQAVDGLGGPQPITAIEQMLAKHLPSQDEMLLQQISVCISENNHQEALTLIAQLNDEFKDRGDVKLAHIDCLLETKQYVEAEALLQTIPLQYQDGSYKSLVAKLELHKQAAESPELKKLEQAFHQSPTDYALACELAALYHDAGKDEQALELLWNILIKDLNANDGEVKKSLMDILAALGQGHTLSSQYRRKLYSLLY